MAELHPSAKQILLAEDEPIVLNLIGTLLRSWGYCVFSAYNGREALKISGQHPGRIDLLVSDVIMPEIRGPELAELLKVERPQLKVILVSGYSQGQIGLQYGWKFLQKPFAPEELKVAVEDSFKTMSHDGK